MVKQMQKIFISILAIFLLPACAPMHKNAQTAKEPGDLAKLENISVGYIEKSEKVKLNRIKLDALNEAALSLGARTGLFWRAKQINESLKEKTEYLDRVFNFNALLLDNNILPPVLTENKQALNLDSPQSIRISDTNYKIIKQARFVTVPPVWRDYLFMHVNKPEMPDNTLLPKTKEERDVWKKAIREGWEKGILQAEQIYVENLNRLKRDYQGMIRYRTLLAQNMVSLPLVAKRSLGVTGGGEELSINDRTLTIKALPSLKADTKEWLPIVTN